jgi:hypothetical protein
MNATIQNGGVTLRRNASSSRAETADVRSGLGASRVDGGTRNVTFIGYGAIVGMDFLSNQTAPFTGGSPDTAQNVTLEMPFLLGGNVVMILVVEIQSGLTHLLYSTLRPRYRGCTYKTRTINGSRLNY